MTHAYSTWITRTRFTHWCSTWMIAAWTAIIQLNYVKQIIILLRNTAGARTTMEMYCYTLGCYLTIGNSGYKSGHAQRCRGYHLGPQIGQPRRYAGRIGALGYLEGCRFAGQIDKDRNFFGSAWTHVGKSGRRCRWLRNSPTHLLGKQLSSSTRDL
jgi:hypothetical protein